MQADNPGPSVWQALSSLLTVGLQSSDKLKKKSIMSAIEIIREHKPNELKFQLLNLISKIDDPVVSKELEKLRSNLQKL